MYRVYEGDASIVLSEDKSVLYVNKYAAKHGNKFTLPAETSEMVDLLVTTAKKLKVEIACNTTQVEGKAAKNRHSIKNFLAKCEQFETVVTYYSWSTYLAFQPGPGQMVGKQTKPAKLSPNAITR